MVYGGAKVEKHLNIWLYLICNLFKMKNYSTFILVAFAFYVQATYAQSTISAIDLKPLIGNWNGSLTYLDYSTGQPYTMPANIEVKQGKIATQLIIFNRYPNEPKANSTDTLNILDQGKKLNNELVKSSINLKDGCHQIITEYEGTDGNENKSATIRHTYTICSVAYSNRKDVKFIGEDKWIKRHEYSFTKTKD